MIRNWAKHSVDINYYLGLMLGCVALSANMISFEFLSYLFKDLIKVWPSNRLYCCLIVIYHHHLIIFQRVWFYPEKTWMWPRSFLSCYPSFSFYLQFLRSTTRNFCTLFFKFLSSIFFGSCRSYKSFLRYLFVQSPIYTAIDRYMHLYLTLIVLFWIISIIIITSVWNPIQ